MRRDLPLHLIDAGRRREDLAVDRFLNLAWAGSHFLWFQSLGIHPTRHWALLRATLQGIHPRFASVEIDIVLGDMGSSSWPPCTDYLVAVEAKGWKSEWEDLEPWNQACNPQTNLWDQVKRNRDCGFDRVAGLDIICTEPAGNDYWEALEASDTLGRLKAPWLMEEATKGQAISQAGYALLSLGAVSWKDESMSGTLGMLECRSAPLLKKHETTVENIIRSVLQTCPRPQAEPHHFVQRPTGWGILGR